MTLDELDEAWQVLTFREKDVLTKRFGLDGEKPMTLRATGKVIGVCNQRIVQIQAEAMRKLRCAIREIETHGKLLPTTTIPNGTVAPTIAVTKWKTKPKRGRPRKPKPPKPPPRTDTERLDWLERWIWGSAMVIRKDYYDGLSLYRGNDTQLSGANLRELLDLILFKNVSPENK